MKKLLLNTIIGLSSVFAFSCSSETQMELPSQISNNNQVQTSSIASYLKFDASNPEIQKFVKDKGFDKKGYKTNVNKADLVYTYDNWKSTNSTDIRYLIDNSQGFMLRSVPANTEIEYSVHAWLCHSLDNFRSCAEKSELWVNNDKKNYKAKTESIQ